MSLAVTTTMTPTNSSDANFRAWGSAIGVKLAAMGLVQTADTGQINWATVTAAVAINTVQGYEIWRFADTLQATFPVFFKFEFGSGSAVNNPSIHLTVGNGSNGTGTINGVTTVRTQFTFTATATPITVYWCGDTNRFVFAIIGSIVQSCFLMSMERSLDSSGVVTSEAVLITVFAATVWSQVAWNTTTGPYTLYEVTLGALGPEKAPFGSTGTQVALYPVFHNKGVYLNYGMNLLACVLATVAPGASIAFIIYGSTHTFMPVGGVFNGSMQRITNTLCGVVIRYE